MPVERILIGYDGSARARRAIEVAGHVLAGAEAVVLHVGVLPVTIEPGIGIAGIPARIESGTTAHTSVEEEAHRIAGEGVKAAEAAGLRATPRAQVSGGTAGLADLIATAADEIDAFLIVLGSHGHGPLRSALLGSVSAGVLSHTTRPVLVVPQAD